MTSISAVSEARDLSKAVAAEIRAHMGREDVNRVELARRLGVDNTWVGKRLNGQTEIGLTDLQRIARALNVAVIDLLPKSAKQTDGASTPTYAYEEDAPSLPAEPELVDSMAGSAGPARRVGSPLASTYPRGSRPPTYGSRRPTGPRHAARTGR